MKEIFVTQPFLPPLEEVTELLGEIWESKILTNAGPLHNRFEAALNAFLRIDHSSLVTNGTVALSLAIQADELSGEVITTPFSFVATAHAIVAAGLKPRFVDIDAQSLNVAPDHVAEAITRNTSGILAVHCYGVPCDVGALGEIAQKKDLRLIYDAAHAFGVQINGQSVLRFGDMSTLSFHATKSFNTFEGGLVACQSELLKRRIDLLKNFGITSEIDVEEIGTNGKMNEFSAAMGLLQLKYYERVRDERRQRDLFYRELLDGLDGISILQYPDGVLPNYSYFPIFVGDAFPLTRDELHERLVTKGIRTRRYFYPLITNLKPYRNIESAAPENLPVANKVASEVLCLPIYPALGRDDQALIAEIIRSASLQRRNVRGAI